MEENTDFTKLQWQFVHHKVFFWLLHALRSFFPLSTIQRANIFITPEIIQEDDFFKLFSYVVSSRSCVYLCKNVKKLLGIENSKNFVRALYDISIVSNSWVTEKKLKVYIDTFWLISKCYQMKILNGFLLSCYFQASLFTNFAFMYVWR